MKIKNKLAVTRGEGGGRLTGERRVSIKSRNMHGGPTGIGNRVGIDCGRSRGEQREKMWDNCN